ncbi:ubiquitin carboxyl-terminal hydrolase 25 isoform X2 [Corylus avellana]|uniref:ubiquitin carboxyl-terminal hydrolase 25 isoform X2 n=1 Tax=Corylus avellana TaxID=13451 RepID=UPI00286A3970|nr:ubiquitin carboxyl-terminal hydrolase 25 isoform X2 [Corylus avellana]
MALQLQMSWQPSLLSQKRKSGPPLGLKNLGNSCYLNSVLQCLTYTPPLANFCLKCQHSALCDSARDCPFCILEKRIARSLRVDLTLDAPVKIQSCLKIFAEHFRGGRQEDAHEFLRYVIDACHNTCLRLKKLQQRRSNAKGGDQAAAAATASSTTVVKEIFGGALQSQVKCLSCGNESNKVDDIMDISLDVLLINSLKEALQKFFQPEVLDGNNKYKCDNCKKLVAARKQMSILQAPNVLVIQLKRFEGIFGGKIDKAIAFEEVLVLSSFMCKASQDPRPEYKLFGTIVHSGYSQESGHYYAYIKDAMGRWYCCNDSFVSLSTLQEVLSEKVYILFFSRTNQRPASASTALASNGTKSSACNGSEAFSSTKAALPPKAVHAKAYFEQSSQKDISTISKVDKVTSSPQMRFSIGNSNSKRAPATGNGRVDVHKSKSMETNGFVESLALNGTKSSDCNGSEASSSTKAALPHKAVHTKAYFEQYSQKDISTISKVVKVTSSPQMRFSIGNSNSKKAPASDNGRVDVHKSQSMETNGDVKHSICREKSGNDVAASMMANGFNRTRKVGAADSKYSEGSTLTSENGNSQTGDISLVKPNHGEGNGTRSRMTRGGPSHDELETCVVHDRPEILGSKRKSEEEDSCILFAQDAQSQAEVGELKEVLEKEASSILRSCGWSDNVYSFMSSRKRLCREARNGSSSISESKKFLIADAKPTFISQIPESLKEDLIERLRLFSQGKKAFSRTLIN